MVVRVSDRSSWVEAVIGLLAVAGLADSLLLTFEHYKALELPCTFSRGCQAVLTSAWSSIGPIPVAVLGVIFYGALLFGVIFAFSNQRHLPRRLTLAWATLGLIASVLLILVQAFSIHAWCQYCLLSAVVAIAIFIVALIAYRGDREEPELITEEEETNDEEA